MKEINWDGFEEALVRNKQAPAGGRSAASLDEQEQIRLDREEYVAFMNAELDSNDEDLFEEVVAGAVRSMEGDPEGVWNELTYMAYDPKRVLRALKAHHDADSEIDPLLLMETFMHDYDYRYAHYARFAIGTIVGFKRMTLIRTQGKRYWQTGPGRW